MAKINVDIPKEKIDDAMRETIKLLEKEIRQLRSSQAKLKKQVAENDKLVCRARKIIQLMVDEGDFIDATDHYCM